MRPTQRQRYTEQIDRVLPSLHAMDLSDGSAGVDLEKFAAVANLSPSDSHRVFRLMTGESVGEMVRRLRVAKGVALLRGSPGHVTQAFARAVRRVTGWSPTDMARSNELLALLRGRLVLKDGQPPLSIDITSVDPFVVQAMRNVGDYRKLDATFGRLFDLVFAEHDGGSAGHLRRAAHDPWSVPPEECRKIDGAFTFAAPVHAIELGGGRTWWPITWATTTWFTPESTSYTRC